MLQIIILGSNSCDYKKLAAAILTGQSDAIHIWNSKIIFLTSWRNTIYFHNDQWQCWLLLRGHKKNSFSNSNIKLVRVGIITSSSLVALWRQLATACVSIIFHKAGTPGWSHGNWNPCERAGARTSTSAAPYVINICANILFIYIFIYKCILGNYLLHQIGVNFGTSFFLLVTLNVAHLLCLYKPWFVKSK